MQLKNEMEEQEFISRLLKGVIILEVKLARIGSDAVNLDTASPIMKGENGTSPNPAEFPREEVTKSSLRLCAGQEGDSSFDSSQDSRRTPRVSEDVRFVPKDPAVPEPRSAGLHFGISVTELGLLFHVMQQVGLIKNENMRDVAAFLAEHCRTIGREQIAKVNLYKKFSAKDKKDLERLDNKLTDAVNLLRKWKRRGN